MGFGLVRVGLVHCVLLALVQLDRLHAELSNVDGSTRCGMGSLLARWLSCFVPYLVLESLTVVALT